MFLFENYHKIFDSINIEEYILFPPMYSQGRWQCQNTCKEDLAVLSNFIRLFRPLTILECGTFEARTTEYIFNLMRNYISPPRKLITIDVPHNIGHIDLDIWVPEEQEDPLYVDSVHTRKLRLALMQKSVDVEVIYLEGLTREFLADILVNEKPDFIYQDASHLQHLLEQEWRIVESIDVKKGTIICFDDMKCNNFVQWFKDRVKSDWYICENNRERGQLWVEKI